MRKKAPWETCCNCHKTPSDDDLVKSVYCSTGRYADDPVKSDAYLDQLTTFSNDIQSGTEVQYDNDELDRLRRQKDLIQTTKFSIFMLLVRIASPAIICFLLTVVILIIKGCTSKV
jgi:hypothetical protein